MSTAVATAAAPARERSALEVYRDDGPLARLLGVAGAHVPLPPAILLALGALPLFVLMAVDGAGAPKGAVAAAIGWFVLLGGLSSGRPHRDRLRWAVPALVRAAEYSTLIWIAALADASGAALALLCALAYRHYDLVYRLRHQGVTPPDWVGNVAGGWDGRVIVGYLLWVAGALPEGFYVAAALLGVIFVSESIAGWRRFGRMQQPVLYDDEEDAAE